MDAISIDIAGLTTEGRNGLSFEEFAEVAWAILRFTYTGDNVVEILKYSSFDSHNIDEHAQRPRSAFAYHIDGGLSLSEIARSRQNIAEPAHSQRSAEDINTYRLHSLITRAILVSEHENQEYGIRPSGGINGHSNSEAASFADLGENLVVRVHGHKDAPRIELRFPKTSALQNSITYVADTFGQLGRSLSQHPNSPLKDLSSIGPLNKNCIQRSAKAPSKGSIACLGDILLQQEIERPEHLAINSWDGTFTYSELYYFSFRLAAVLLDQDIAPEERILLCMRKSRWAIVAMFGILLAGATCIPLDINSPPKRLQTIHEKVVARIAVVDESTASLFEKIGMKTVTSSAQLEHAVIPDRSLPKIPAAATAFIYFTSGSTGTPKGVVLEHGALMAAINEVAKAYSLDDTSKVFQFAAYTFDVSMGDIFGTLSTGGCLCIPSEEERMDQVAAAMNKLGTTHACLTSTVLAHIEPEDVISLRYLFVGGEALDRAQFLRWKQRVNFNVVYGTTESLIWDSLATSHQLELDGCTLGLSIGSWLWVVHPEEAGNLKPIGAIGEILVEGPLLAKGYLDDPVTTLSKFVSAPQWLRQLRQNSQTRCYRTGDMGYYNANGTVSFVGRLDTQIKIRGQRIELEEIERSISLLEPSFKQVVVEAVTLKSHKRSKTLAAFVHISQIEIMNQISKSDHRRGQSLPAYLNGLHDGVGLARKDDMRDLALPGSQSLTDLFQQCQRKVGEILPHNMIPNLFVPMQGLPRALTGKLDRKALRQWAADLSRDNLAHYQLIQSATARKPETTNEKCLQRLWSRLLGVTEASLTADDHFFQLSGDSVLAMDLVNELRNEGKSLSVKQIFENPRLCDMAIHVNSVFGVDVHEAPTPPFVLVPRKTHVFECVCEAARACKVDCISTIEDVYPATPMQEAVLAISAHREGAYRHQAIFKLPSTLDLRRFVWAWETLVAMHSIFRTRLVLLQDSGLLQIVFRPGIAWRTTSSLKQYLREDNEDPMGYGTELSRFALVTDGDDGATHFIWSGHHAIYDGWSLPRAFAQTASIYSGQALSKPIVPFSHFVSYLSKLNLQKMDDFWRGQFSRIGAKFPELPSAGYVPAPAQLRKFTVKLDRVTRSSITTATLIQAAWALITAQQAGADHAVFGLTLSGRDVQITGITDIVGPTMTTVPLEIDVSSSSQSVANFLGDLQKRILYMKQYQHIGLQRIRRLSSQAQWASTFQNLLVIHPVEKGQTYRNFTSELGAQLVDSNETDFLDYCLTMKCTIGFGVLHVKIHFDEKVVSDHQVQRLVQRFEHVISQLAEESNSPIGKVQTASPLDFQQLAIWNDVPSTVFTTVHGMVEEQVRQRPGAIATIGFDGAFTYAELDFMATMLAHDLAHVGAGPEVRIVLCFAKSTWPIIAMFATLKCGGVCVSINPDEPDRRAREICEDVEATILLCDATYKHRFLEYIPNVVVVDSSLVSKSRFFESSQRPFSGPIVLPSNAAFVVYTSGSTGRPKGSLLEHQSICTCLNAVGVSLQAGPHSRVLQFCAYTFDMHILEIFCTLAFGGSVCVISEAERMDDLSTAISRGQVNTLIMTPTVTRLLSSATISLIDTLLVSGEPLTRQELERWAPHVRLVNGLGPSECCPLACVTSALTSDSDPLCIGRPIGCRIWITEPGNPDHLLPIGCTGEMLVEGPIVGRGYINRPEATSAAFIFNPLWSHNQSKHTPEHKRRLYRSGDLARYNFDGTITFIGRTNDTQIKIHGQRVELGEIEYHLKKSQSEYFEQVAVAAIPIKSRDNMKTIVAFARFAGSSWIDAGPDPLLVMNEERTSIFRDARHQLHHRIPRYMVPAVYVPVRRMPLSTNGKLDRNALQQWVSSLDEHFLSQYYLNTTELARQPQTPDEKCLQKAWGQVLKVPGPIAAQDHFFQLGGDSILAMELVTNVRSTGKSLTVSEIFQRPRLCEMAADLKSLGSTQEESVAPFALIGSETNLSEIIEEAAKACNAKPALVEDIYPATPMQEALLAVSAHRKGAYHFQASFKLPNKSFDIARFKAAWEMFIKSQAIFRTRIIIVPSGLSTVQVVLNSPVDWFRGASLVQYLQQDYETPMTYGTELSRYSIVSEDEGGKSDTNPSYFVWSGHHAVYDGWSLPRAFETVSRIYEGQAPRPAVPYSNFVRYVRELDTETMDDFWRDQFPDTTDQFPSLPSNYTPTPTQIKCFSMDLHRSKKSHITTATLIQSAWAIVTARYMDTDEAIFGLILSGRDLPLRGILEIQGPTIATVPLRINIDNTQSIREFLGDVQNQVSQVKEYQHIGLQRIRHLSPEARLATSFQNLLVIHPTDIERSYDKLGLGTKFVNCAERDLLDLALTIQCTICPLELKIQVFFDDLVIPGGQLDCILHQFEHVLSQLATESPTTTVYNIETISPFDSEKLSCWNAVVPSAHKAIIHGLVEAQLLARPSATATTGFDVEWTYQELDSLAKALAQRLTRTGKVSTETRVALCFHKSSWPIVAILAVLKCGGVCVSISPEHPMGRLLEICNDAEISVLLCDSASVEKFTPHFSEIITVNSSLTEQTLDPDWIQPDVAPDNAAFVVYSSGSTGKPKGSLLTHQSLCSFLKANTTAAYMSSASRTLQFSSYIFDGHIWEILGALTNGGCVCVLSESERMENLADTAEKHKINWAVLTPTVGRLLSPEQVPSLETLILTGEPLLQQDVEKWADKTRLLTGLGPSECSVMSFITEPLTLASKCTNIGRPVGCRVWLADHRRPEQRLVPIGCAGEILIEGPILGRGYINRPQLNAEAFLIDPKWAKDGTSPRQFYRSGDLARQNPDGTFTIIGRKDTQLKIRGQRIELGDIEHHLKRVQPSFEQVAAEVLEVASRGNIKLLAAFVRSPEFSDSLLNKSPFLSQSSEIRRIFRATQRLLADSLPRYMVPSLFIPLRKLPVNASGKMERKVLRQWIVDLPPSELDQYLLGNSAMIQPVIGQKERLVQQLWARVLRVPIDSIGADDNFFQLGGDSVTAMELIALLRAEGCLMNIADLFEMPELRKMAMVVVDGPGHVEEIPDIAPFTLIPSSEDKRKYIDEAAEVCNIPADLIEDIYPIAPMQEALLAISAQHLETYRCQEIFKLPESLDIARFKSAWEKLVDAYAIFRTRIILIQGLGPVQLVLHSRGEAIWHYSSSLDAYLKQDNEKWMEFGGDLNRMAIFKDADSGESYFIWTGHHAIYDGWSLPKAFEEVIRVYQGQNVQHVVPFNYFIRYITSVDMELAQEYWREQFPTIVEHYPHLPSLEYTPRPLQVREATIPLGSKGESAFTVATTIQAAWALTLARKTQKPYAAFGLTLSGRDVPVVGIEDIIGPTITTVPVKVNVESVQTIAGFLSGVQEQMTALRRYQHTGLQNIRHISRESQSAVEFQNLLVIHIGNEGSAQSTLSALGIKHMNGQAPTLVTHALTVECKVLSDSFEVRFLYDHEIIQDTQLECLSQQFKHAFGQLSNTTAGTVLDELDMISQHDLQLIERWTGEPPKATEATVHGLVEAQALLTPDAEAVTGFDGEYSYRSLNLTANKLAVHLRKLGVGLGDHVVLCFTKSTLAIVAMLAVLKVGAACVSVSPDSPASRIERILDSVGANVLLGDPSNAPRFMNFVKHAVGLDFLFCANLKDLCGDKLQHVLPIDAAFVVFTSGSTGTPKGTILEHRSVCTSMLASGQDTFISAHTRALQFSSYAFDAHITEIFATLFRGGCVCVVSENERMNYLTEAMHKRNVNWAMMTPTLADMVDPLTAPSFDTLVLVGEVISLQTFLRWKSHTRLVNGWGPSECAVGASHNSNLQVTNTRNIGFPNGCRIWITEESRPDRLVPVECIGEMLVEGPIVGRGYINQPDAAAFITNPDWSRATAGVIRRFYRTGDLGRYNIDGTITFVGRTDNQVKIHGQRVELGEIEFHIKDILAKAVKSSSLRCSAVAEVFTLNEDNTTFLVAFVHVDDSSHRNEEALNSTLDDSLLSLKEDLAERLPAYMIPKAFIPLADFPISLSGKVDRKYLREMGASMTLQELNHFDSSQGPKREPKTAEEHHLRDLWATVLGIESISIGAGDSFLRIGGDSVRAMRLVGLARQQGLVLTVADIFKQPRLCDLARKVTHHDENLLESVVPFSLMEGNGEKPSAIQDQVAKLCGVDSSLIEDVFPCTALQEGLLAMTAKRRGDYIAQNVLELQSTVKLAHFKQAWERVWASTSILRTRIVDLKGHGIVQAVLKGRMKWSTNNSVDTSLSCNENWGLGTPLTRFIIVEDKHAGRKWLIWKIHHAIYDGRSLQLLIEQVRLEYIRQPGRALMPFQNFVKHITLNRNAEATMHFWRDQLADSVAQAFPALPSASYQPCADKTVQHHITGFSWPNSGVTPSTVIRAAWSMLTATYTGTDEVIFGAVVSGLQLPVPDIERVAGPTISTVPVRVKLSQTATVYELQVKMQAQASEMIAFEQTGLQQIRRLATELESASHFQTLLVVQPRKEVAHRVDREQCFFCEIANSGETENAGKGLDAFSTYVLTLICDVEETGLNLRINFDSKIMQQAEVERLAGQLEHVIRQTSQEGTMKVKDITIVSDEDVRQIWKWNATAQEPVNRCVHDILAETVQRHSNSPAIYGKNTEKVYQSLTYYELDQLSTKLAHHLVKSGIGPGVMVPLCFEKSLWTPITMLGVMKAGAASVALDSSQPEERLRMIVEQVQASVILSSIHNESLSRRLIDSSVPVLVPEVLTRQNAPTELSLPLTRPSDTLYTVFTSGSTGKPKGAMISHQNFSSAIQYQREAMGLTDKSRVYDFASYSFDAAWWNMLHSFATGACLCIPLEEDRKNHIAASIVEMNVSFAQLTPTIARLIDPATVTDLQTLVFAGEPATSEDIARWSPYVQVKNFYGPAECSVAATGTIIGHGDNVNIGRGLGCNTWVLDTIHGERLAPIGALGELWLEGPLVGQGYLSDPQTTDASFYSDPNWLLNGAPGIVGRKGRLYKTGDLVRYNIEGSLSFVGRKDAQVKLRGQRVELGEVEHHVKRALADEDINIVAEVILPKGSYNTMLVVFLSKRTSKTGITLLSSISSEVLEERLSQTLPVYMIPSAFIPVDEIPVTATGKVDRVQLRKTGEAMTIEEVAAIHPSRVMDIRREPITAKEHRLRDLWASVLGIDRTSIGRDHSFLRLGGDSISSMRLVAQARKQALLLTVTLIFTYPRLGDLAKAAEDLTDTKIEEIKPFSLLKPEALEEDIRAQAAAQCQVFETQIQDVMPCTPLQEGLLAMTAKRPASYISRGVFELRDSIDVERFKAAWEGVIASADILRTRIAQVTREGLVQILLQEQVQWDVSEDLEEYIDHDKQLVMGLGTPLTRFAIASSKQTGKKFFVWTIHHALYDQWTGEVLFKEVEKAYQGLEMQPLPPFKAFIKHISEIDDEEASRYWENEFEGSEAVCFPRLPSPQFEPEACHAVRLDATDIQWPQTDITASNIIRMAWSVLLARCTASQDVVFGVTNMGRRAPVPGIDRIAGPTIATVPVRIKLDLNASVEASLKQLQVKDTAMATYEHTGITRIRRFGPDTKKGGDFQTLLLVQPAPESGDDPSCREIFEPVSSHSGKVSDLNAFNTYALMLVFQIRTHGFRLDVSYDVDVISTEQVNYIRRQLENVVRWICTKDISKMMIKDINAMLTTPIIPFGNLDRRRFDEIGESTLPNSRKSRGPAQGETTLPMTDTEVQMRQIWASILGIEASRIAIEDDFLLLGGNSVQAMRLVGLARERGLSLKVSDVFNSPCLGDLAKLVTKELTPHQEPLPFALLTNGVSPRSILDAAALQGVELTKEDVSDILPVTEFQTECISSALTQPLGHCYHFFMDLPKGISIQHVQESCIKLWNHFDILRAVFTRTQGQYWQIFLRNLQPDISIYRTEKNLDQFSRQLYIDDLSSSLSLGKSFSRFLITHTPDEHVRLTMRISHAQYDGVSLGLIQSCFAAYFNGDIPAPNPKFAGFIQHSLRQKGAGRAYWRELLADSTITHLQPTQRAMESEDGVLIPGDAICVRKMITAPCSQKGATQASIFIASCACVLAKKNNSSDVVFGLVDSGRSGLPASLQNVVGPCNSTVPVRIRFDSERTIDHALEDIRVQQIQGSFFTTHPFSDIVRNCTDWQEDTKEFGVSLQFQNIEEQSTVSLAGVESSLEVYTRRETVDTEGVFIFAQPVESSWAIEAQACGKYHSSESIADFVEELSKMVSSLR